MEGCATQNFFFFPLMRKIAVGLGNRFPLTHSTSILSTQITSLSATDLFQHRGACLLKCYNPEGTTTLPDLAWWSSEYIHVIFFIADLRSYAWNKFTAATLISVKCHHHLSKSFLWSCGASSSLSFGTIFRL